MSDKETALFPPTVGGDCTCFSTAALSLYNFWLCCCFMLSVASHAFQIKSVLNNFCCQNQAGLREDENLCQRRVWTLSWWCGFILIYRQIYACFLVIKSKELSDLKWPLSAWVNFISIFKTDCLRQLHYSLNCMIGFILWSFPCGVKKKKKKRNSFSRTHYSDCSLEKYFAWQCMNKDTALKKKKKITCEYWKYQ